MLRRPWFKELSTMLWPKLSKTKGFRRQKLCAAAIIQCSVRKDGVIVNYAEIRARVANGFIEKANEMADALAVLQDLSRASSGLREQISKHCPK